MLTADEVQRLAALSQISLTAVEIDALTCALTRTLAFVDLMEQAEVGAND